MIEDRKVVCHGRKNSCFLNFSPTVEKPGRDPSLCLNCIGIVIFLLLNKEPRSMTQASRLSRSFMFVVFRPAEWAWSISLPAQSPARADLPGQFSFLAAVVYVRIITALSISRLKIDFRITNCCLLWSDVITLY